MFRLDNAFRRTNGSPGSSETALSSFQTGTSYIPTTGRISRTSHYGNSAQIDTAQFNASGDLEFSTQTQSSQASGTFADRMSYYSLGGVLRAADARTVTNPETPSAWSTAFEEYWYDALGRRVLVLSRRSCAGYIPSRECRMDFVRRTVWDGDQELYEIQMPYDRLHPTDGWSENDTARVSTPPYLDGNDYVDAFPFYGRLAYTVGLAVDQPLSITSCSVRGTCAKPPLAWTQSVHT